MTNYDINVGHFAGEPGDCEVYGALKTGGYLTLFYGTEQECREHVEQNRPALNARLADSDRLYREGK